MIIGILHACSVPEDVEGMAAFSPAGARHERTALA